MVTKYVSSAVRDFLQAMKPSLPEVSFYKKMSIIDIKVITNARQGKVKTDEQGQLRVYVTVVPQKGEANEAVIKLLADHFGVKKREVVIVKGLHSNHKTVQVG